MNQKFIYKPKPVWVNPTTRKIYHVKPENEKLIYFPSKGECSVYVFFRQYLDDLIDVTPHYQTITGLNTWSIDFRLDAKNTTGSIALACLINKINNCSFSRLNTAFVEYKGIQDKNFKLKMGELLNNYPMFTKTLILISSECGAFGCEGQNAHIPVLTHPVVSFEIFKKILQEFISMQ